MPLQDNDGRTNPLDAGGFLLDANDWTPEIAAAVAHRSGVDPLLDRHWKVISLCREWFAREGQRPDLQSLVSLSGLAVDELGALFGRDPVRQVACIAGLPSPDAGNPVDS